MVVQTRGDEPSKPEQSWAEKYAPYLIAAGVLGGGALLAGGTKAYLNQQEPEIIKAPKHPRVYFTENGISTTPPGTNLPLPELRPGMTITARRLPNYSPLIIE